MSNPDLGTWPPSDRRYRRSEVSAVIGSGDVLFDRAAHDVLRWRVKTASGFSIQSTEPVSKGERLQVTARVLWVTVVEPVEVVSVIELPDRVGFAYRTLPGHPVSGEEAFVVHRDGEQVRLTIRSLTRAAPQKPWRLMYPLLLVAQQIARRRYLRALR
jgi:uncharacterized protein (UPF0548 family)